MTILNYGQLHDLQELSMAAVCHTERRLIKGVSSEWFSESYWIFIWIS